MLALPTLTLSSAAARAALRENLASRLQVLEDDRLRDSPEAEDLDEALNLLASEVERHPHTLTIASSNALRVIAASRDDLIADGTITPLAIILTDTF